MGCTTALGYKRVAVAQLDRLAGVADAGRMACETAEEILPRCGKMLVPMWVPPGNDLPEGQRAPAARVPAEVSAG